ncbi:MAG: phosphatidate cytidylyltransferase [Candidatus Omnitrophica bacterium]|nr:phosphatidate cytidylyltransferase [Candidatus Omnitrophota bacterium]
MLYDQIVKNTLVILLFLFGSIFVLTVIFDRKKRSKEKVKGLGELWLRYITFLFIAPAFLIPAYFGRPVFNFLIMGMAALYLREFFQLTQTWQHRIYRWEGRIFALIVLLGTLFENKFVFFRIPVFVVMFVLATPVFLREVKDSLKHTTATIVGILYFGWMFSYAVFIRDSFGFGGIIFVCFLVTINDLAAFWVGKALGKRKLIPEISPNKTVEGALGGIVITAIFALVFKYALPQFSYLVCIFLGVVISLIGQMGDLVLSVIKRDMCVKDSGKILPGHGGVLDRFDSWIFSLPLVYYLMHWLK